MNKLKVLELFGGIGACSKALERLGIDFEIVDYVEIDKYAVASFNAIHNTNFLPQDICKWDKDIEVDLIMHGSPCQDFSLSGKNAGGDEGSGTRSSLMYETLRIVEKLKPKYIIWENVKNILSKKHIHNFNNYLSRLEELGYKNYYQILNAKDYGIPQNRERVFTISIYNKPIINTIGNYSPSNYEASRIVDIYGIAPTIKENHGTVTAVGESIDFIFPLKQELKLRLKDILEDNVDEKYYIPEEKIKFINETKKEFENYTQYDRYNGWYEQLCRVWKNISPTIHLKSKYIEIYSKEKIRKLTPKECWRLMGFSDEDFEKASKVNSNSQLYKQAGNSIVVNVLVAILKNLLGGIRERDISIYQ